MSAALVAHDRLFSPLYVGLIRAGEKSGDVDAELAKAPERLSGEFACGGQDHFYLEGQVALAVPGEGADMAVYSSTQHPTEVQHGVAHLLGIPFNLVTVALLTTVGAH